jgi:chromosome segregation ATPase
MSDAELDALVARLRSLAEAVDDEGAPQMAADVSLAADAIDRLRAELASAREIIESESRHRAEWYAVAQRKHQDAKAATERAEKAERMVDELSMRGTRANFDTSRELHETTKELSACIARADAAESKLADVLRRVREAVASQASCGWMRGVFPEAFTDADYRVESRRADG